MANLTYEQLKKLPQYKIAHKMYYKKYPFCVRFYSNMSSEDRWEFQTDSWKKDLVRYREITLWLKNYADFEYRTRHDYHLALYVETIEALSKVYKRYRNEIEIIEAPSTASHYDLMISDLNITVREKLFYNDYRYKISSYLYRNQMDRWIELIDVIENSFDKDSYRLNPTLRNYVRNKAIEQEMQLKSPSSLYRMRRWIPYSGTATVYLGEYDDVCTLHMMFKDIITNTTKIILKSEL